MFKLFGIPSSCWVMKTTILLNSFIYVLYVVMKLMKSINYKQIYKNCKKKKRKTIVENEPKNDNFLRLI